MRTLMLAVVVLSACSTQKSYRYPEARRAEQVDKLFGVDVADPYRWLEDPDSDETRAWVKAENALTFGFLDEIAARPAIKQRLTELWDFERFDLPWREGGRYFYRRNSGLQNQSVLFVSEGQGGEPRELLDPNTLAKDGTAALQSLDASRDGKLLAYGISRAGSDWVELRVREVDTGKDREDIIRWVKFSNAAWTQDGSGFYYARYDEPKEGAALEDVNFFQKLYLHRLGTPQSADVLVYERQDEKEWGFSPYVTRDGRYLVVTVSKGTDARYIVMTQDLSTPGAALTPLVGNFDADYTLIGSDGPTFFFRTTKDAPRGRLVAVDVDKPFALRELVPQQGDILEQALAVGDKLVASYLRDALPVLRVFGRDGALVRELPLPGVGSVGALSGDTDLAELFFTFEGYAQPRMVYRADVDSGELVVFRQPKVRFDPASFETTQVFVTSKDGTRVPMLVTHKRGVVRNGDNPTLMYGYGGFNISITPWFSVGQLVWLEMGGVLAIPSLRGGGEYGEEWHDAGRLGKKQNVFDDLYAGAEWLVDNGYTNPKKLAVRGGSNGGLLVGAAITQRPELFGAALPAVGVMDMLRFHKFTIGWAWVDDYGSPDEAAAFAWLYAYSPLHNLKAGTHYPATLITTADHDDRVVPAHSFKFAAAIQAAQGGPAPVLIRIEEKAGHGAGKPTMKQIETVADEWSFLVETLGMDVSGWATATAADQPGSAR